MPKQTNPAPQEQLQVPTRMPQTLAELDRAIMLLGSMGKVALGAKARLELTNLLGCMPGTRMAPVWKLALKRRRKALVEPSEAGGASETGG